MKNWFFAILVLCLGLANFNFVFAKEKIEIYFFYSLTCPHCASEKIFLKKLKEKYPEIDIKKFAISERKNVELLKEFYENYKVPSQIQGYVPITFIEEKYFLGFNEKIGQDIENYILKLIKETPPKEQPPKEKPPKEEPLEEQPLLEEQPPKEQPPESAKEIVTSTTLEEKIEIPILGEIDPKKFSLPVLAVILGFFDGFNVCSLGALVLILAIVLALKSRNKTLILGGTFILTTGIVYGILIILWYKLFLVLSSYLRKMEILIGILAILGAIYFLREFLKFKKRGPVCEFGGISQKLSQKFQKVFEKKAGILTLIGAVFLFASIITIVEFPCSAVLPVIFASILSEAKVSTFLSLLYIGIFLFFYLLDEIIVFLIAVFTMKLWIASPKFVTFLNLVCSIMLFFLGIYYLFGF